MSARERGDALLEIVEALGAVQVHLVNRTTRQVKMRILESGDHQVPMKIDDGGIRGGKRLDFDGRSHCDDRVTAGGHSLRVRARGVSRPDLALEEYAIRVRPRRLSSLIYASERQQ